jgi:release factor glutamine methyltransferase
MSPSASSAAEPSLGDLVEKIAARLRLAGSETPRLDAELLVGHTIGRDRAWLAAHSEAVLPAERAPDLEASVARRATGEPIAYIRGYKDWLSLRVAVDGRALIPRPETELLGEAAIAEVERRLSSRSGPVVAWDVGTGSGALALALAARFRAAVTLGAVRLVVSDVSPAALELASENLADHRAGPVQLVLGDLLEPAGRIAPLPDVVIANLPYIPHDDVGRLPVAASFEPRVALDGGPDGLSLLRRLISELPERMAAGGVALLEVGTGQASAVLARLPPGFGGEALRDLAGAERVVRLAR